MCLIRLRGTPRTDFFMSLKDFRLIEKHGFGGITEKRQRKQTQSTPWRTWQENKSKTSAAPRQGGERDRIRGHQPKVAKSSTGWLAPLPQHRQICDPRVSSYRLFRRFYSASWFCLHFLIWFFISALLGSPFGIFLHQFGITVSRIDSALILGSILTSLLMFV